MSSESAVRAQNHPDHSSLRWLASPSVCMVAVGFALRMSFVAIWRLYQIDVFHWNRFEMASIAKSLAVGDGFSSPWIGFGATGPTAWTAPVYPALIAAAFRLFGIYSYGAAIALLTFNSAFSALTSFTVYRIACRVFNRRVAVWSGWIWAIYPAAIYWSVIWIWETTFSAFLLSLLFLLTIEMENDGRLWPWFRYGALWGLVGLTNTSLLAWLPFSGCWIAYQLYRNNKRFLVPAAFGAIIFWSVVTPWIVRDYRVFGKFMLVRGDLGSELRAGNNPLAHGNWVPEFRAGNNPVLFARYKEMGEIAFDKQQEQLAKEWIAANPQRFLGLCVQRAYGFWFAVDEQELRPVKLVPLLLLTPLSILGLLAAIKRRVHGVFLFATLIIFYPLVYYITLALDRYHHAIEPELVILAVFWVVYQIKAGKERTATANG